MIRPPTGHVLLRILPEMHSAGGIEFAQRHVTPEEQQQLNHRPTPPPPLTAQIVAIGPWRVLGNGMRMPPPFPPESKVLLRPGSGRDLEYGTQKFKVVAMDDILAVLQESVDDVSCWGER